MILPGHNAADTAAAHDAAPAEYCNARTRHWDNIARTRPRLTGLGGTYHQRLAQVYRSLVSPGLRVLEIGCERGDLLAALQPSLGVGVDLSPQMIALARRRHPTLQFIQADAHHLALPNCFDVIILSDVLDDLWDVQTVLERLLPMCGPHTRVIINSFSRLWEQPLSTARRLGLAEPLLPQSWLAVEDVKNLLHLAGFETIRHWNEVLLPLPVPLLSALCNRILVRLWPLNHLALTNFIVARPVPQPPSTPEPLVSVIIPARNEAGNIPQIFARVPEMGGGTELVFVEGHSTDDTLDAIQRAIAANPHRRAKLLRQTGRGKGDAVRLGFANAAGQVLMILDADLTVPPEDLPRFYQALRSGKGEFINGVRLVYPMEKQAMQTLNLLANKIFGMAFSWLLGQPIKDTLCGTKCLHKHHYEQIAANRAYFGDFDPFGDFDLIFGAARLNLKFVDLPVRYRERTYGSTNINRFRHGWLLLRMLLFAARRIKFT